MDKKIIEIIEILKSKKLKIKSFNNISPKEVTIKAIFRGDYKKLISICEATQLPDEKISIKEIKNTLTGNLACSIVITC